MAVFMYKMYNEKIFKLNKGAELSGEIYNLNDMELFIKEMNKN